LTPAKPWVVLLATLTVQALVAMALLNLPVVAPAVAKDIGISTNYLGAYVALVYFGAMVATLLGGAAVKRWGAIRLSQAGLVSAALVCSCVQFRTLDPLRSAHSSSGRVMDPLRQRVRIF